MKRIILSLSVISMIAFTSCKNNESKDKETLKEEKNVEGYATSIDDANEQATIVGVASDNEDFSTLVTAVEAADLVETLNSEGPFTVFAPTNDAFNKLPEGTLSSLLEADNKAKLSGILTYHVVSGEFKAADVISAIEDNDGSFTITTVQGEDLIATLDGEDVILTDANGDKVTVVITDVDASNGVIHAIDAVLMPKS